QLYETFLVQSGRGVSRFYLRLFTLGDLFNLIGCLLADQLHTQVYLGFWFLAFDLVLMCQLTYYDRGKADLQYHLIDANNPSSMIITPSLSNILNASDYGSYNQHNQPNNNRHNSANANTNRTRVYEQNQYSHTGDGILSDQSNSMSDAHAYQISTATSIPQQVFDSPGDDTSLLSYGSSFGGTPYGYCSPSVGSRILENSDHIASRSNSISSRTGMDQSLFTFFNERTREIEYDPMRRASFHRSSSTLTPQRQSHDESHMAESRGKIANRVNHRQPGGSARTSDSPDTGTVPNGQAQNNSTRLLSVGVVAALCLTALVYSSESHVGSADTTTLNRLPGRVLMGTDGSTANVLYDEDLGILNLLGVGFGILSATVYLFARIPQVVRICRYGAVPITGVGAFVMWCGIIANVCYGASVAVYCLNWTEFAISIPWLLGSSGCVPLDMAIFLLPVCYHVPPQKSQRPPPPPSPSLDIASVQAFRDSLRNLHASEQLAP
ncbi:hypothetical protein SARC_08767, partial [Sphaeroforma arctica JP610]